MEIVKTSKLSKRAKMRIVAAVVVVGGFFALNSLKGPSVKEVPLPVRPVRTVTIAPEASEMGGAYQGVVEASQKANLSFRVSGPLVDLPAKKGMGVKKGDLIARIDPRDFRIQLLNAESQLAQMRGKLTELLAGDRPEDIAAQEAALRSAQARYDEANANYNRYAKLVSEGAISQAEFDTYKTGRAVAQANLDAAAQVLSKGRTGARKEEIVQQRALIAAQGAVVQSAQASLKDAEIRAPFAGILADVFVENYQFVGAQENIASLQNLSAIDLVVQVPDSALSRYSNAKAGNMTFEAVLDSAPDKKFPAYFYEIATQADPGTQTYALTLRMPYPKDIVVLPGMAVTVYVRAKTPLLPEEMKGGSYYVPADAVFASDKGEQSVWILKDGAVNRIAVSTGAYRGNDIEVTSEKLIPGSVVVTAGANFLQEGQKVRLLEEK